MSSPIEWTELANSGLSIREAKVGQYKLHVMALAIVDLSIQHAWYIIDTANNHEVLRNGITRISVGIYLINAAEPEDASRQACNAAEKALFELLWERDIVEGIILGD